MEIGWILPKILVLLPDGSIVQVFFEREEVDFVPLDGVVLPFEEDGLLSGN